MAKSGFVFGGAFFMKLRKAIKVRKQTYEDDSYGSAVLYTRATLKWHKWMHRLSRRDLDNKPWPSDLHNSRFRTKRCQSKKELLKLWYQWKGIK